jgi:hypothetical protein
VVAKRVEWRLAADLDQLAVKVLDLQCDAAHSFEGWFGSEQDYQDQAAKGLVACPMCASTAIVKKLSAPRLNLKSLGTGAGNGRFEQPQTPTSDSSANTSTAAPVASDVATIPAVGDELQARMLQVMREVITQTEDVGAQFADQARAMHYGEAQPKAIRGQATPEQARELVEEGIDVMPLVLPEAFKKPLQ